jgi:hypothetical protein
MVTLLDDVEGNDPEKFESVFRKDHAQARIESAMAMEPNPVALQGRHDSFTSPQPA